MESGDTNGGVSTTQFSNMSELERLTKALSGWKELLNMMQNVLLWKQQCYSYCIGGAVTVLFLFWWWMNVSVLTTFACIMFIMLLADYIVPSFGSKLLRGKPWDGEQERQYESACQQMINLRDTASASVNYALRFKQDNPKSYAAAVCANLFFLGLIGYWFDNTFLCYLFVLTCSLLPGALHNGHLQRAYGLTCQKVLSALKKKKE